MDIFFSSSLGACTKGKKTSDGVLLTAEEFAVVQAALAAGKILKGGADGKPVPVDAPAPAPLTTEEVQAQRLAAYRAESDPLKLEAEHDALVASAEPDYTAWLAKVAEIKARYPLPEQ